MVTVLPNPSHLRTNEHVHTIDLTDRYNNAADLWESIRDVTEKLIVARAMTRTDLTHYWGAHLQFFKQLIMLKFQKLI